MCSCYPKTIRRHLNCRFEITKELRSRKFIYLDYSNLLIKTKAVWKN